MLVTQLRLTLCDPKDLAHQTLLPMKFSRQEDWSGLLFPSPVDLPDPGIKPTFLASPALAGEFFATRTGFVWVKINVIESSHSHCEGVIILLFYS